MHRSDFKLINIRVNFYVSKMMHFVKNKERVKFLMFTVQKAWGSREFYAEGHVRRLVLYRICPMGTLFCGTGTAIQGSQLT